jgi:hypothetical protein
VPRLLPAITVPRARALVATGRLVSGVLLIIGILGMLDTRLDETAVLVVFTIHPLTAVVWFVLGVAGVAMSVDARLAQLYLASTGALLVVWAILGLVLDGSPSDLFARDAQLIALHLVGGLLALGVAVAPPVGRLERVIG